MKEATHWDLYDLNQLLETQAEESSQLEFKRANVIEGLANKQGAPKLKEEITKDVSAFANRSGGVIVYGIEEEESQPHQAKAFSPIDVSKCSKEKLEQIIWSGIRPPIRNARIKVVKVSPSGYAYIVVIPKSHTVHQASDGRYYRRGNFGNQIMEDDEIREAMSRQIKPTYSVVLDTHLTGQADLWISGEIQNTSPMVANDVSAILLLPIEIGKSSIAGTENINDKTFVRCLDTVRGQVDSHLKPFEKKGLLFENSGKISEVIPPLTVPLYIRVYDQFGQALEVEFTMSLQGEAKGHSLLTAIFGRDA